MHYSVAVVFDNINNIDNEVTKLLSPYDENLQVTPYIEMTVSEIISHAKRLKETAIKEKYDSKFLTCETDNEFYQKFIEDYEDKFIDESGNLLTTYNPNSKWDWWSFGGRFVNDNYIALKDGSYTNVARLGDIDWDNMLDDDTDWSRNWDLYMGAEPVTEEEQQFIKLNIYSKEYYLNKYGDKQNYINTHNKWCTYAMCNLDGWFEQGKMGWFIDDSNVEGLNNYMNYFYNYLIDPKNQDKYITVVDCHI